MSDLIKRSDVYKAVDDWLEGKVPNLNIKDIPSADRPSAVYEYLKSEIGDIVDSETEFDEWFKRMVWHVEECNRIAGNRDVGYVGLEDDYLVSVKEVLDITAETGALETQRRVRELTRRGRSQEWIPCSERLPEDVQIGDEYPTVIFCTKENTYAGFYEYYLGGRWWAEDGDYAVDDVIAWMPLPEPWKGADDEMQ